MTTLTIQGMKCQHCVALTKKILEESGATDVSVDLGRGEARFEGVPDLAAVRQALAGKGFTVVD